MLLPKIWIICRVCLQQHDKMLNIFENVVIKNLWTQLRDCGGVPVRKKDDLPDKICEACFQRLCKANNFRNDCQRGHRELVQILTERSLNLYELDLEEEKRYSNNDVISISHTKANYSASSSLMGLETGILTELAENNEVIAETTAKEQNIIENKQNISNNTKQYCVVTKNNETENIVEKTNEPKPIVLFLKLKNAPKTNTGDSPINPTPQITGKNSNKIQFEKAKLKSESIKAKTVVERSLKTKSNNKNKSQEVTSKFTCRLCKNKYKTYDLLRHHMYTHKRPHQCKICKKRFSQIQSFLCHNNMHTGIKPYYCRFCYQTFSDMSNRNSHERNLHKKQEYKCEKCNKNFRFITLLHKHAQSHRQKKCFICNKEFASLQMVRKHHQLQHLKLLKNYNKIQEEIN